MSYCWGSDCSLQVLGVAAGDGANSSPPPKMPSHSSVSVSLHPSTFPLTDHEQATPRHSMALTTLCQAGHHCPFSSHPLSPLQDPQGSRQQDHIQQRQLLVPQDLLLPDNVLISHLTCTHFLWHPVQGQNNTTKRNAVFPATDMSVRGPGLPEPHVVRSQLSLVLHGGVDLACGTTRSRSKNTEHGVH